MPDPIDWQARCLTAESQNAADAYLIGECVRGAEITDARERESEAELDALKARALAAEVALVTILKDLSTIADGKAEEVRDEFSSGEAHGWDMALRYVYGVNIDLTAARELVRKAGEADGLALLVGELRGALEKIADDGVERSRDWRTLTAQAALALPLPDAAKKAAAERTFCIAALAYADAKASIEDQAAEYKRTLVALQAARGTK